MYLPANTFLQNGKYRIIRFISSGGFGCTYEAEHVLLEERVAIKEFFVKDFCNRDETTSHVTIGTISKKGLVAKLRRKFIDEARALRKLHHEGIVNVQDVFEENGTAYYVMDYVDGKSLSEIVREQGPLSEERSVRYISQVATALQYVHDNNRLHLDIKPGNIMIDGDDNPILIDFGASKQYDEEDGENTSTLLGKTPGYAPLEQMSNSVVKFLPATDIYALGATLYKLLTGVTPPDSLLRGSGEELEPLPQSISASTRAAVAAALQMNKTARPQSLAAFLELLSSPAPIYATEDTEFDIAKHNSQSVIEIPTSSQPRTAQIHEHSSNPKKAKTLIAGVLAGIVISMLLITLIRLWSGRNISDYDTDSLHLDTVAMLSNTAQPAPIASAQPAANAGVPRHQEAQVRPADQQKKDQQKKDQQSETSTVTQSPQKSSSDNTHVDNTSHIDEETIEEDQIFTNADTMPSFQGGDLNTFRMWIARNVNFPPTAIENNISGRVIAQFIIEKDGSISNIKILQTPDACLSAEVIRVLSRSPKWSPGKQHNQTVRVQYTLPVDFHFAN